jgi:hypothetical protein
MLTWLNLKGTSHVSVLSISHKSRGLSQSSPVHVRPGTGNDPMPKLNHYRSTMPLPSKSMQRNIYIWRNVQVYTSIPYLGWERESETKREWERITEGATYILLNATSSTKKNVSVVIDVCLLCRLVSALHSWVGPFCLRGWRSLPPTT